MASKAPPTEDVPEPVPDALALTVTGQREAVSRVLNLGERYRSEVAGHLRSNLLSMYGALVRSERPMGREDLRPYFTSFGSDAPKQALYADPAKWWDGVGYETDPAENAPGREQLIALPGIYSHRGEAVVFKGLTPEDAEQLRLDDEDLVAPLDKYRSAPKTVARRHLDERVGPHADEHADLLTLWVALRDADGSVKAEDINREYTLPSLTSDLADRLAGLPGIERERVNLRAEDVELDSLETLADLRAAEERVEGPTKTTFEYVGIDVEE